MESEGVFYSLLLVKKTCTLTTEYQRYRYFALAARENILASSRTPVQAQSGSLGFAMTGKSDNDTSAQSQLQAMRAAPGEPRRGEIPMMPQPMAVCSVPFSFGMSGTNRTKID